jgi:hypothetical protein
MKYEQDNRTKRGLLSKVMGPLNSRPDTSMAAKSGTPQMENYHPTVPLDVPATAAGALTTQEVGITVVGSSDVIDKSPDARQAGAAPAAATPGSAAPAAPGAQDQPAAAASTTAGKKGTSAPKKLKQVAAKPPKIPKVPRPSKKATAAQKGTTNSVPTPDKKQ